jgi:hypothetical protein
VAAQAALALAAALTGRAHIRVTSGTKTSTESAHGIIAQDYTVFSVTSESPRPCT